MKLIPLSGAGGGHSAIVDDDDYEWLSKMKWYVVRCGYAKQYLSVRTRLLKVWDDGYTWGRAETMHRVILGKETQLSRDIHIDHINNNTLDNRKENLRPCTRAENIRNSVKRRTNNGKPCSSKYKGVIAYPYSGNKPWNAQIRHNGVLHNLGYFSSEEEAALAYDEKARELNGEFARTNFESGMTDGRKVNHAS